VSPWLLGRGRRRRGLLRAGHRPVNSNVTISYSGTGQDSVLRRGVKGKGYLIPAKRIKVTP